MKKTKQLRELIESKQLEFIMEAHSALSAKIVEEAGFKGIWASGLSLSAALGVRDNNEASWTQVLDILEFMSDATSVPILLDGDTGYGNFNNARRLVKKLEQRGIPGVCIEDKLFPKTNSFIKGEAQPLADINEFCGKIKAMKDSQNDEDFVVVSRVEAFIAGWGLKEALKRAEAYRQAGTDAVLIHSKRSDMTEIEAFMKEWGNRLPVIIVPTKYYSVPTDKFSDLGISLSIWANHNLRSSITAMQKTSAQIYYDKSLINVENNVSPLEEVFRLQNAEELDMAEKLYLSSANRSTNAMILVKESANDTLINEQMNQLKKVGVTNSIKVDSNKDMEDKAFFNKGELYDLYAARDKLGTATLISDSNIVYKTHVFEELIHESGDITIVTGADYELKGNQTSYVTAKLPYSKQLYSKTVDLIHMSCNPNSKNIHGEFIGLWKVSGKGTEVVKKALEELAQRKDFAQLTFSDFFNYINLIHPVAVKYTMGSWIDNETYTKIQKDGGKND
ncbi:phosphoenolpyruvate mutase [Priestia megaterium]|uniref:phosphoenolpyruvate mutase n=1 Tax=Priestia megaterium TaxID=1404 RepID=UPI0026E1C1B2|nr:phosphoenolpyruvate mutase [Priestia megaterium]MDO6850695.1 phosphoenolpyruvate mutase [Priestia megaterium]